MTIKKIKNNLGRYIYNVTAITVYRLPRPSENRIKYLYSLDFFLFLSRPMYDCVVDNNNNIRINVIIIINNYGNNMCASYIQL